MKQVRIEDTCADKEGKSLNRPYTKDCDKRLVCNVSKNPTSDERLVTFPSGKGPTSETRLPDGRIRKCRVKDAPKERKGIWKNDGFDGVHSRTIVAFIERSLQKLTKEQQDYIRPYVLSPINIELDDGYYHGYAQEYKNGEQIEDTQFQTFEQYRLGPNQ